MWVVAEAAAFEKPPVRTPEFRKQQRKLDERLETELMKVKLARNERPDADEKTDDPQVNAMKLVRDAPQKELASIMSAVRMLATREGRAALMTQHSAHLESAGHGMSVVPASDEEPGMPHDVACYPPVHTRVRVCRLEGELQQYNTREGEIKGYEYAPSNIAACSLLLAFRVLAL